jgi:hypothetical protein
MVRSSFTLSHFLKKYKQDRAEPPVEGDDETGTGFATAHTAHLHDL